MKENKQTGNSIFAGIFWKLGERTLAQLISFVVSIVLARILMPEDYGTVALVTIFITLADVCVTSGFGTSLIQKSDADELDYSTIFYCGLAVAVGMYCIIYFAAPLIAGFYDMPILISILRVFGLRIPIGAYNSVQHAYVSRHMIFKKFFFSTLIGTILSAFIGIAMAIYGFGVWALVAQYMSNTIVDSIVLSFSVKWRPKLMFSWDRARALMSYGWKVLAADLIGTFFDQLRSLIIGKKYVSADLAFYNKGQQIPNLVSSNLTNSVMTVLFPAMANCESNIANVKEMTRKAIKVLSYLVMPMMAFLGVIAEPLTIILLTEKWKASVPFMQIICVGSAFGIIGGVSLQTMKAIGRSDKLLKLELYKKPVYLLLLVAGAMINPIAIAVTLTLYNIYGTIVNYRAVGKLIGYSVKEQLDDMKASCALAVVVIVGGSVVLGFRFTSYVTILLQIVICGGIYIGLSKIFHVYGYIYIRDYILRNIKEHKNADNKSNS